MSEIAHNFNHTMMIIGLIFFLAVGICLLRDRTKKDCSIGEHKWSNHLLGKYCLVCKLKRRDFK